MIFRAVQEDKGFDEINAMVLQVIRGWVIGETRSAVDRETDNIVRYKLQNALAGLLKNQGDLKQAEAIYEKTLAERTNDPSLGPKHPDTLISMEKLAVLLRVKEKYEDAEKVFADCLSIRREQQAANGIKEADCFTLNTMHNLAIVFSKQKAKLEDAKVSSLRVLLSVPNYLSSLLHLLISLIFVSSLRRILLCFSIRLCLLSVYTFVRSH